MKRSEPGRSKQQKKKQHETKSPTAREVDESSRKIARPKRFIGRGKRVLVFFSQPNATYIMRVCVWWSVYPLNCFGLLIMGIWSLSRLLHRQDRRKMGLCSGSSLASSSCPGRGKVGGKKRNGTKFKSLDLRSRETNHSRQCLSTDVLVFTCIQPNLRGLM